MQAYIAISYHKRLLVQDVLDAIIETLKQRAIIPFVFVQEYDFKKGQDKEMMRQAFADIDRSDILIAEVSDKAIGIGIEVGYAKARNKPVVYVRHQAAEYSSTVGGSCDFEIIYNETDDLQQQLKDTLEKLVPHIFE